MVTIIIPNYNSGGYLLEAVKSALNQHIDKKIIIVDDVSTDDSIKQVVAYFEGGLSCEYLKGCDKFAPNREEVDVLFETFISENDVKTSICILKNHVNSGVAHTRNIGIKLADDDYIAFLDSDDLWEEDKLVRQIELLRETDAVLCNTARRIIEADGTVTNSVIPTPGEITLKMLEKTNCINCSSVVVETRVMQEILMEHSEAHEDYLAWLKILKKYGRAVGINEPLLLYRLTEKGKSRSKLKSAKMTFRTYRLADYGLLKSLTMMISYMYNGLKKYRKSKLRFTFTDK